MKKSRQGFTLIELCVCISILAIIVAIAVPSYREFQKKTNRSLVQAELVKYTIKLHKHFALHSTYKNATLVGSTKSLDFPKQQALYRITFQQKGSTGSSFLLVATPKPGSYQSKDGVLCINELDQKIRATNQAACLLTDTSTWN